MNGYGWVALGLGLLLTCFLLGWGMRRTGDAVSSSATSIPSDWEVVLRHLEGGQERDIHGLRTEILDRGAYVSQGDLRRILHDMDQDGLVRVVTAETSPGRGGPRLVRVSATDYGIRVLNGKVRHV